MTTLSRDEIIGMLSLIAGVALFSTVEVVGKVIGHRVDPFLLVFIRFSVTGILLLALSTPLLRLRMTPLGWKDYRIFLLNGFIGIALAISLFHIAILTFQKAASAAVVFCANPVFVMILSRFINKERWSIQNWIAVMLGLVGVSCFAWESGSLTAESLSGLTLMLLAAFLFALSICISKRVIPRYGAMVLMGFTAMFGCLLLLPFAGWRLWQQGVGGLREAWLPVLYIAVVGTALAYALYYFGLLNIAANKGSMTFFLKPVLASVLAAVSLGEHINVYMVAGTILILAGLFVVVLPRRQRIKT